MNEFLYERFLPSEFEEWDVNSDHWNRDGDDDSTVLTEEELHDILPTPMKHYINKAHSVVIDKVELRNLVPDETTGEIRIEDGPNSRELRYTIVNKLFSYRVRDKKTHRPCLVDIRKLVTHFPEMGIDFHPDHFSKISFRTGGKYRCLVTIYKSGKIVTTGIVHESISDFICERVVLDSMISVVSMQEVELYEKMMRNLVTKVILPYTLCLNVMTSRYSAYIEYMPSNLAVAIYRGDKYQDVVHTESTPQCVPIKDKKRSRQSVLFFEPNMAISVGVQSIEVMKYIMTIADQFAYDCRAEDPVNRSSEAEWRSTSSRTKKRKRQEGGKDKNKRPTNKAKRRYSTKS